MTEWVTAGYVFMCSALPLGALVINGYRFIIESAMLPALLTLSVTQSDARMCTQDCEHSLDWWGRYLNVPLKAVLLVTFPWSLPPVHVFSIQRTSLSCMGKTRRTLSSMACLPLQGMCLSQSSKSWNEIHKYTLGWISNYLNKFKGNVF